MTKNKPGRPARAGKTSSARVEIRLTKIERASWARAAKANGCTVSEWIRKCATAWYQHQNNVAAGYITCGAKS